MNEESRIEVFWDWFRGVAPSLAADVQNDAILGDLDARVHELDSELSWEVGPGSHNPWQLVISPNLDRNLRQRAEQIVSRAPVIRGWEFHSARKPKDWQYKFVIGRPGGQIPLQLDASGWGFVLLQYPDGSREVLLHATNLPPLDSDERWQAAAVTLESILGEDVLLDKISEFELVNELEPRFADKLQPIQRLREAVLAV
jgi:hypothetical protein